jgi:hypothetical protein
MNYSIAAACVIQHRLVCFSLSTFVLFVPVTALTPAHNAGDCTYIRQADYASNASFLSPLRNQLEKCLSQTTIIAFLQFILANSFDLIAKN